MEIAVIYWSGTGNTKMMAEAVAEGIAEAGAQAVVKSVSEITPDEAAAYDKIAFGCSAMGAEVLEETEFEPFFTMVEDNLKGKKVVLFGSYGWGAATCRTGKPEYRPTVRNFCIRACLQWANLMTLPDRNVKKSAAACQSLTYSLHKRPSPFM